MGGPRLASTERTRTWGTFDFAVQILGNFQEISRRVRAQPPAGESRDGHNIPSGTFLSEARNSQPWVRLRSGRLPRTDSWHSPVAGQAIRSEAPGHIPGPGRDCPIDH